VATLFLGFVCMVTSAVAQSPTPFANGAKKLASSHQTTFLAVKTKQARFTGALLQRELHFLVVHA